jgi:hypothetical protein
MFSDVCLSKFLIMGYNVWMLFKYPSGLAQLRYDNEADAYLQLASYMH